MTDFMPKEETPLKTQGQKLIFAQSIANIIFGEDVIKNCPTEWEEVGGNHRFNLCPSSNDWFLHPPGDMTGNCWRLSSRYRTETEMRIILAPFAKKFV